jgi:hypothetical protein
VKPNLICFLNAQLHQPGFRGFETWPKTIEAAYNSSAPILITSTTESDCYLDLERVKKVTKNDVEILLPPVRNPFFSTRPERNFVSEEDVPIMFKNNFLFVVSKNRDLIEI